jgi:Holliday junction resolvase RusA-like endonuclease
MSKPIIITGRPITKKNSGRIIPAGRAHRIIPSKAFKDYETQALWQLKACKQRFSGAVSCQCLYYMPNKASWPDLIGLLQATSDILEAAGIIDNDRNITDYDGSKIVGVDKDNPRTEVILKSS